LFSGTPVEVRCIDGYWIRPGLNFLTIHCLADGRWSNDGNQVFSLIGVKLDIDNA